MIKSVSNSKKVISLIIIILFVIGYEGGIILHQAWEGEPRKMEFNPWATISNFILWRLLRPINSKVEVFLKRFQ